MRKMDFSFVLSRTVLSESQEIVRPMESFRSSEWCKIRLSGHSPRLSPFRAPPLRSAKASIRLHSDHSSQFHLSPEDFRVHQRMESNQKPRVRERITGLFKKPRNSETSQSFPAQADAEPSASNVEAYGDRERTLERYREATKLLENTVKGRGKEWGVFDFPELKGEPESFDDSGFKDKIDTILQARRDAVKDRTALGMCGHALQRAFTAFSPFAKNFLTIASKAQSVLA